ncbi:hypothetical protein Dcar01_02021 [Deinococcus carri]|uniref:DUF1963 domain-containing protein n=1 Tax=Deinococcus carri TaxID=1211323 RepID=A0ABP9W9U9_9DEIO
MTGTQPEPPKRHEWQHPVTGERITLTFAEGVTRLERGRGAAELPGPAFDEVAALREAQEQVGQWDPFALRHLREMAKAGVFQENGRTLGVEDLGFPARLWEELAAFEHELERQGGLTVTHDEKSGSLLWNPTPAMRERFRQLMAGRVQVSAPPADTPFHQKSQELRQEGFLRLTSRNAGGSLWLPPVLEPYRPQLQASERPVVRLAAEPGREPRLWESKVGGVPYRPKGAAWPHARGEDTRPLVFLAQVNFAELNGDGQALPDFPSRGLLQFFILNDDFYGAEMASSMKLDGAQKHYRVLYWPEVVEDEAALDTSVPRPEYDPQEVARLREGGFESLIDDSSLIWEELPYDWDALEEETAFPFRPRALAFLPDHEPVSGADGMASAVLGVNIWAEGVTGHDLASVLYNLSPGDHKLGGYPNFTQSDPRQPADDLILLFQLDSDERLGLMWGDVGTANFFIRPQDLKRRDFSKVAYHWDCG